MANTLTLTNSIYLYAISFTASSPAGIYTIVPANNTYDRRIYGISLTNTSANVHNSCTLWLSDGTKNYQIGQINIPASAGATTTVGALNIFGDSMFSGMFTYSMADTMGVYYFNLPKTWSLKFTYTNTISTGNTLAFTTFGEIYDGVSMIHTSNQFQQISTFINATGTSTVNLLSSAAYNRRIYGISVASTDATARTISIRLSDGTNSYLIYTFSILANSGNTTTILSQDLFYDNLIVGLFIRVADSEGVSYYFNLPAGWSITGSLSVSTAGTITVKIIGETYE